jgi:hypothetical protein
MHIIVAALWHMRLAFGLSRNCSHEPITLTRLGGARGDTGSYTGPIIKHTGRWRRGAPLLEIPVIRLDLFSLPFSGIRRLSTKRE